MQNRSKASLGYVLHQAAGQLLGVADELDLDENETPETNSSRSQTTAEVIGDIGDELTAIARLADDYNWGKAPPTICRSKPDERLWSSIQTLKSAADAVVEDDKEIAGVLRAMADQLEAVLPAVRALSAKSDLGQERVIENK